ncbi:MAG: XisI protein [Saprospiraceae bacterium]
MEKVKKYETAILKVLGEYAVITSPFMPDVENKIVADTLNHRYQLIRMGWHKDRHVHYTVFHFDILEGKVWVQENRTDVKIDDELVDAGIARQDIISGLQHPALKEAMSAVAA